MADDALRARLAFVEAIGGLKSVQRRNYLADGSRVENSAEHSWHVAVMATICAAHCDEPIDLSRVVLMLLIHDIVEVQAGDTYLYDAVARSEQEEKEQAAAEQLYGMLPETQGSELLALWREFEARKTPEARYARAIDALLPLLQTTACDGWDPDDVITIWVGNHQAQQAFLAFEGSRKIDIVVSTIALDVKRSTWGKIKALFR